MASNILNLPTEETLQSIATALSTMQGNVSGVKGNEEVAYRTGQVNLTAANIGALPSNTTYVSSVNGGSGAVTGIATQQELDEVRNIAEGAGAAMSFANYATLVSDFNNAADDDYKIGQSIYINTLNVPDLWIYEVSNIQVLYYYTTDEAFIDLLKQQGYVQLGYYKVAMLETEKVDLTNYVTLNGTQTITGTKSFTDFDLINDYTNGKTLASYLAGKVDTTSDAILNVINASDIAISNILTNDQISVITNGKPTLIKGEFLGYTNPILMGVITGNNYGNRTWVGTLLGSKNQGVSTYAIFSIKNTNLAQIEKTIFYWGLQASNEVLATFGDVTVGRNLYFNKGCSTSTTLQLGWNNGNIAIDATSATFKVACNNFISRNGTNSSDLGSSAVKWKNLYLAGEINPNANTYGLTLPDTTSYTANKEIATVEDITTNITGYPAYDSTATYAVGDKVLYNGLGYRCTTAVSTAESFDDTKWTQIQLKDYVDINTNQVVKGTKTFKSIQFVKDTSDPTAGGKFDIQNDNGYNAKIRFNGYGFMFTANSVQSTGTVTFGTSNAPWSNIYTNKLGKNNGTYGITLPDMSAWTTNKEIATTDQITPQWYGTQSEYDNLSSYDSNTIYNILES